MENKFNKIYVTITTVPQVTNLSKEDKQFELFKKKYQDSKEYIKDSDVIRNYYEDGSKNPTFSKIYSLSVGCIMKDKIIISIFKGEEGNILKEFFSQLQSESFKDATLVGWNFDFLFPHFLWRSLANGIKVTDLPKQILDYKQKPWNRKSTKDLQAELNPGWLKTNALEAFSIVGLDSNFIDGSEVYDHFIQDKHQELYDSSVNYMFNFINLDRVSEGLDKIEAYKDYQKDIEEPKEIVKLPPLERLYNTNSFSQDIQEDLKQIFSKKKMTKKDKVILEDIVNKVYSRTNFIDGDQDTKAVKEAKIEEVKEFFENL